MKVVSVTPAVSAKVLIEFSEEDLNWLQYHMWSAKTCQALGFEGRTRLWRIANEGLKQIKEDK